MDVVERWIPGANIRRDFAGIADILCAGANGTRAVQTTTDSNVAARVRKITDSPFLGALRAAGWQIHVHGWRRAKRGWTCRVVDLS